VDFTSHAAIRLADDIEAAASADMYAAADSSLGLRVEHVAGATVLLAPRIPVNYFNRAIGLGGHEPATERGLDTIIDLFRTAGVVDFWLHVGPGARPDELPGWLAARGLRPPPRRSWAKFLRAPAETAPRAKSDLEVRVATAADATEVGRTATTAFGMPPQLGHWFANLIGGQGWQVLVAEVDGRIAATGSVFLRDRTAWVGIGATLPDFRKLGAQTALLAARIAAAKTAGCTVVATETGESVSGEPNPSFDNIRRAGFTQVCSRLNFASKV
jgi:GNAT superfamily N-acetyltransferase